MTIKNVVSSADTAGSLAVTIAPVTSGILKVVSWVFSAAQTGVNYTITLTRAAVVNTLAAGTYTGTSINWYADGTVYLKKGDVLTITQDSGAVATVSVTVE
jgi:hypothetical protein